MHSGAAGDFKPSRLSGGPEQRDLSGRLGSDKIITSLKSGKISFQDLQEGKASMKELLEYVPLNTDGIRELHIFDVPSKSTQSTMRLFIKEEKLFDSQGEILTTQINDPLYQAHLKEFRNTQHYSLDFVDEQRPITSSKILQAKQDVETLYQLNELFNDWYTGDMDDEAINDFFDKLSDSQRRFLGVEARQFEKIPEEDDRCL